MKARLLEEKKDQGYLLLLFGCVLRYSGISKKNKNVKTKQNKLIATYFVRKHFCIK
jgi:hypothetical protein